MKYTTLEIAARVGVPRDRIDLWLDNGHLRPLNPGRRRVQGRGPGFLFGRQAVFAAVLGRLAEDAGLGPVAVAKIVRFADRADLERRFAAGMTTAFCGGESVQVGHANAAIVSHGPIQLVVLDLEDLWAKVNRQLDTLEAAEAAEPRPGGRPRELVLKALAARRQGG